MKCGVFQLESVSPKQRTCKINLALAQLYQKTGGNDRSAITAYKEVLRYGMSDSLSCYYLRYNRTGTVLSDSFCLFWCFLSMVVSLVVSDVVVDYLKTLISKLTWNVSSAALNSTCLLILLCNVMYIFILNNKRLILLVVSSLDFTLRDML